MKLFVFLVSIALLGILGIIGIYLKFFAVLLSLLVNCIKLGIDAFLLKFFPAAVSRNLGSKAD